MYIESVLSLQCFYCHLGFKLYQLIIVICMFVNSFYYNYLATLVYNKFQHVKVNQLDFRFTNFIL